MALLTGEDFVDLFRTFDDTAFRLEVRESYYEKEQLEQFLAGGPVDISYMNQWLPLMRELTGQGKRVERVRVVSHPFSDYTRYGLWLSGENNAAGEDIRYLNRLDAAGLPNHDYWLFDSSRLYLVLFDHDDQLLGAEQVTDPATIVQHARWRDAAWHRALRRDEFIKATGHVLESPASA